MFPGSFGFPGSRWSSSTTRDSQWPVRSRVGVGTGQRVSGKHEKRKKRKTKTKTTLHLQDAPGSLGQRDKDASRTFALVVLEVLFPQLWDSAVVVVLLRRPHRRRLRRRVCSRGRRPARLPSFPRANLRAETFRGEIGYLSAGEHRLLLARLRGVRQVHRTPVRVHGRDGRDHGRERSRHRARLVPTPTPARPTLRNACFPSPRAFPSFPKAKLRKLTVKDVDTPFGTGQNFSRDTRRERHNVLSRGGVVTPVAHDGRLHGHQVPRPPWSERGRALQESTGMSEVRHLHFSRKRRSSFLFFHTRRETFSPR